MSSENTTQQVKETVYAAASNSSEWAQQNVVNPVRSYVAGDKSTESGNAPSDSSIEQVKSTVYAAASTGNEWAQENVVEPIRAHMNGGKDEVIEEIKDKLPDDEREKIDAMDKDKIVEFLQERHKSTAGLKKKK
ncbi:hypothetical protein BDV18DRAFT_155584 [Aspergillus unguis]